MSKFKVLDLPEGTTLVATVRGTSKHFTDGEEYKVIKSTPSDTRQPCKVRGDDTCWWLQYNELNGLYFGVTTFRVKEQPAVLTPREVFECILEGVPLEYRIKSVTAKQWYDVNNPKNVDLEDIECAEYRKKPTTVLINGISVPAPASKKPDGGYIYCVNLADERVIALDARYAKSKHYWSTKEEAQEVLDAIMTSFSK